VCNQKFDLIQSLDGEFNCQIFMGGLPYLGYARIIHAFNAFGYSDYVGSRHFFLYNDKLYLSEFKQRGYLNEKDISLLQKAKRQFSGKYSLSYGPNIAYTSSVLFHLVIDNRRFFHWVEFIGKVLLTIHRKYLR
jgi:hypothetical protein